MSRIGRSVQLVVAAAVAGWFVSPEAGAEEKYRPLRLTFSVKGLTAPVARDALEKALKKIEAVETCTTDPEKVTVQVRADRTFHLVDLERAVQALTTPEKPLTLESDPVLLLGRLRITVKGLGETKEEAVVAAFKTAPNVANAVKVEKSEASFFVDFGGSKGATIAEVSAALKAALGGKEGSPIVSVWDVGWTGPRRPAEKRPPRPRTGGGGGESG